MPKRPLLWTLAAAALVGLGLLFLAIQGLLVTPPLFVALMAAASRRGWATDSRRYLAWLGGLVVLGFPCDQFAHQEPGDDEQIGAFCERNFGVEFPMFSKIEVNGSGAHPLYR